MKTFIRLATLALALGTVHLTRGTVADGVSLAAGTYQIRMTDEGQARAAGQSVGAERWIEFLQGGRVVGREIASVISAADMGAIAKGTRPATNGSLIQALKGGDYIRIWINRDAVNYLINLPVGR
jgi:hypothetical protein